MSSSMPSRAAKAGGMPWATKSLRGPALPSPSGSSQVMLDGMGSVPRV